MTPSPDGSSGSPGELRALLRLAGPVVLAQVGLMAMGMVDTMIVGHLSEQALAAVALGNLFSFGLHAFGMGVLMAVDPLVSQAHGARDHDGVATWVQRGLVAAALLAVPTALLLLLARPVLEALRQPAEIVPLAADYATVTIAGVPAFFAFIVLRQSVQALHRTGALLAAVIVANVANAILDVGLVFGRWGMPEMGVVGSAWATAGSRWLMVGLILAFGWRLFRPQLLPPRRSALDLGALRRILRLGTPIGLQHCLEFGTFGGVALLMGWLGTTEVASHQVAIVLASFTFMMPMGLSQAAAVRVGHAIGRGEPHAARRAAWLAIAVGAAVMLGAAVVFFTVPRALASAFTDEGPVIALAATLIRVAAVFQIFDGVQVVAIGVLRGAGDTRTPFLVNVLGFVVIGFPLAAFLGFGLDLGAAGLWWGLVVGLAVVAVTLLYRVHRHVRGDLERL